MTTAQRRLPITAAIVCLTIGAAVHAQFVYEAVPFVLTDTRTGDEYTISGTFTTSCNECVVSASELLAWDMYVDGPRPFNFNSNLHYAGPVNVVASPSAITVVNDGSNSNGLLLKSDPFIFEARRLLWRTYPDGGNFQEVYYSNYLQAIVTFPTSEPFVIATAVSDPTSLTFLGLFALLPVRRLFGH